MLQSRLSSKIPVGALAMLGLVSVLSLPALPAPVAAQSEPFIAIHKSDAIVWEPLVEYERVALVVSGPDNTSFHRSFQAGESPFMSLFDDEGNLLPDGVYAYELRAAPRLTAAQRTAIQEAVEGDDLAARDRLARELPHGAIQASYFTIQGGQIVLSAGEEAAAGASAPPSESGMSARKAMSDEAGLTPITDRVVLTNADGVIRNSLCVGFDCPNSPSFSDTTILLMENNTRIKFDDTSVGSFPNNDWEIEANSNLAGGQSYLGFNDCGNSSQGGCATDLVFAVEAGARQNALYVESDGDVGLGTSNPVVDLHVITGNTPTLRLDQDGSSGFAPQAWDVAGNETNFFIRDVTGGSLLPFRIRPGAPTSSIDINGSGNVGLGTSSPSAALHVNRSSGAADVLVQAGIGNASLNFDGAASTDLILDRGNTSSNSRMQLKTAGTLKWSIGMINDVTHNLHIGPNTATTYMFLNQGNGNVGIGTTTPGGKLDVNGTIFQRGGLLHADYVFEPGYDLESIEDHARFMWANRHLPGMPPATVDADGLEIVEIGSHRRGIVEELEKAHIYIETLNRELKVKDTELDALRARVEATEDLSQRIADLERKLKSLPTKEH